MPKSIIDQQIDPTIAVLEALDRVTKDIAADVFRPTPPTDKELEEELDQRGWAME